MKKFVFVYLIIGLLLSGCVRTLQFTEGAKELQDRAAKLRPSSIRSPWFPFIYGYKQLVEGKSNEWNMIGGPNLGYPKQLNLKPGVYAVWFFCNSRSTYAFPSATFVAEENKTYFSRCFNAENNRTGVEIKEANQVDSHNN